MRSYARAVYAVVVCLTVHLSQVGVVPVQSWLNTGITQTMPYDSPGTLVFWRQKILAIIYYCDITSSHLQDSTSLNLVLSIKTTSLPLN